MRRLLPLVIVSVCLLGLTACSRSKDQAAPPSAFCAASDKLDSEIAGALPQRQLELVQALVDTAPPDLKAKAVLWRDGMERVIVRKEQVSDAERKRYEKAATDLQRVAIQQCQILKRKG